MADLAETLEGLVPDDIKNAVGEETIKQVEGVVENLVGGAGNSNASDGATANTGDMLKQVEGAVEGLMGGSTSASDGATANTGDMLKQVEGAVEGLMGGSNGGSNDIVKEVEETVEKVAGDGIMDKVEGILGSLGKE